MVKMIRKGTCGDRQMENDQYICKLKLVNMTISGLLPAPEFCLIGVAICHTSRVFMQLLSLILAYEL